MNKVKISWKNSKGITVSNTFPEEVAGALMQYLSNEVEDVKMESI